MNNFTCRTCLADKKGDEYVELQQNNDLKLFYELLIQDEVTQSDGLPEGICIPCKVELNTAFNFANRCKSSYHVLRSRVSNESNSNLIKKLTKHSSMDELSQRNKEEYMIVHEKDREFQLSQKIFDDKRENFSRRSTYNCHEGTRFDAYFTCNPCNEQFSTISHPNDHQKLHVNDAAPPHLRGTNRNHKFPEKTSSNGHKCDVCGKVFKFLSLLTQHKTSHTGSRPHLCSDCGKTFKQIGALHFHQKTHTGEKKFICDICKQRFISHSVLRVHMRKHTKEKPYLCEECGAGFRQVSDLKSHRRTHTGKLCRLCSICGKKFSTTGQLNIHLRSHTGEKPYKCGTCSKAFISKSLLQRHNYVHSGIRPYVCDFCGKAFNQSSALKTHFKIHDTNKSKTSTERNELMALSNLHEQNKNAHESV